MASYSTPAFAAFIDGLREHFAKGLPENAHWSGVKALLETLCRDEDMQESSRAWIAKKGREYVLHQDPDHGFFVGALVREPNHKAVIHAHANTRTI